MTPKMPQRGDWLPNSSMTETDTRLSLALGEPLACSSLSFPIGKIGVVLLTQPVSQGSYEDQQS